MLRSCSEVPAALPCAALIPRGEPTPKRILPNHSEPAAQHGDDALPKFVQRNALASPNSRHRSRSPSRYPHQCLDSQPQRRRPTPLTGGVVPRGATNPWPGSASEEDAAPEVLPVRAFKRRSRQSSIVDMGRRMLATIHCMVEPAGPIRELAYYYPDPMWRSGDWVKNLVLFFDGVATCFPGICVTNPAASTRRSQLG